MATKADLVDALSKKTDFTKAAVDAVIKALPEVIAGCLNTDGEVSIPGLCSFKAKYRAPKKMKNYLQGGEFTTKERMGVTAKMKPSLALGLKIKKPKKG